MEIQKLKPDIISKIRSTFTLNNVSQCIMELVLNSLDAKSSAVAVRVNLVTFRLQVVDNGEGITKENFEHVGLRYMTNKCNSLDQLEKQVKCYGFRGETLASIIEMSKTVDISSKYILSSETYSKCFGNQTGNSIKLIKNRPSCGTSITVEGFMYNLPVRKNRIVPELELDDIKRYIEYLIIIHPNVYFSVRNDVTGDLILNSKKHDDIISSFKYLHPKVESQHSLMKVSKLKTSVEALLFKGLVENKSLQFVYVNKRPVFCPKIQKFVANLYYKMQKHEKNSLNNLIAKKTKYPVYVMNIKCPHSNVDILLNPSKTMVEFKNWKTVLHCLEKLIYSFFGTKEKVTSERYLITDVKEVKSDCGVSQMCGAHKAYGYKRRNPEKDDFVPDKMQRIGTESCSEIVEATQFTGKRNEPQNSFGCKLLNLKKVAGNRKLEETIVEDDNAQVLVSDDSLQDDKMKKKGRSSLKGASLGVKDTLNKKINNSITGDDIYSISEFTPTKRKIKEFRDPLPIKVSYKSNKYKKTPNPNTNKLHQYSDMNISSHNNGFKSCVKDKEIAVNLDKTPSSLRSQNNEIVDDQRSLYSKFTEDENKGKNLIMDMFLKSTQVYNSEEDIQSNPKSEETLFEEESNFFMENNFQARVNGLSKTMSVSVNIKSTKKIRKQKSKISKCLQTSFGKSKMVSKCVQTTVDKSCATNKEIHPENIFSDSKLAENYTVVFSDTVHLRKVPRFEFQFKENPIFNLENFNFKRDCKCGCHENTKVFNFDKIRNVKTKNLPNSICNKIVNLSDSNSNLEANDLSPIKYHFNDESCENINFDTRNVGRLNFSVIKCYKEPRKLVLNQFDHNNFFGGELEKDKTKFIERNVFGGDKSPYFFTRNESNLGNMRVSDKNWMKTQQHSFYQLFDPRYKSTQTPGVCNDEQIHENIPEELNTLDNFTIDNFGQFQPVYKSTQNNPNKAINSQYGLHRNLGYNAENDERNYIDDQFSEINTSLQNLGIQSGFYSDNFKSHTDLINVSEYVPENKDCTPYVFTSLPKENSYLGLNKDSDDPSKLVITLSNQQKQLILEKELDAEKNLNKNKFLNWDTQTIAVEKRQSQEIDTEWVKKHNNFGSTFYINKRTGFTTFLTPKPNLNQFRFDKRFEFMPKGLSPIMRNIKEVDKSLSQNKKDLLQNYIMESHQDDLLLVKWQNYLKNNDPKEFFDEIYREKAKQFGQCIPNISTFGNKKCPTELNGIISFDKALFSNITVIGQVDKKFIAVLENTKNLVILFDQHAIHERVRLEGLLKAYTGAKIECEDKFILFIPQNDLSLLRKHELYINSLGLTVDFFENGITVSEIPLCLYQKFKDNAFENPLNKAVRLFINEIIDLLKGTRGVSLKNLPPIIQNIINLEACRGAIKFGDSLNNKICTELLKQLSVCKLPFQCAHGRPTLTPLLSLDSTTKIVPQRPNLKRLGKVIKAI